MAAVSLAFALVTALKVELWLAMPFAIAWGVAILSLDRLFVVSLSRKGTKGTEGTWRAQLLRASPRVLLALLLGFVISTPFVLQIFRPEIEDEITILHARAETAYLAEARNSQLQQQINQDQAQVNNLTAEAGGGGPVISTPQSAQLQNTLNQAKAAETNDYNRWQCQLYGSAGGQTCQPAGNGPLAKADQQRYEKDVAQVNSEQSQFEAKAKELLPAEQKSLQAAQAEQAQELSAFTTQNENNGGLLIRLQALDAVTGHDSTLNAARWLLFLLFVIIDCMPVMIKVMLNLGPKNNYDKLLEAEEQKQLRVAEVNREFRETAEMMAAGTVIGEQQSRLEGWNATIPEVTQNIIAARTSVEARELDAWKNARKRRLHGENAATSGQITDVEPPINLSARPPTNAAEAPQRWWQNLRMPAYQVFNNVRHGSDGSQWQGAHTSGQQPRSAPHSADMAQPVNFGNSHKSRQAEHSDISAKGKHPGRQRRDWLSIFAIPVAIAVATIFASFYFTNLQNGLTKQQHQDDIEQTYLGDMRDFLLNQHLSTSGPDGEVRKLAIEKTVTTLQLLDARRNGIVLGFLRDAGLIGRQDEVIDLSGADLSGADLRGVNLAGVDLAGANLNGAHLSGATLTGASLSDAILTGADLTGARLGGVTLTSADLSGAHLSNAILAGADLAGANNITQHQLDGVNSCRDAILPAVPVGLTCYNKPTIWLTYWYTESPAERPVILKLIQQFEQNKNNQGIRINPVPMDFFKTRAAFTAAAAQDGSAPDVLRSDLGWTRLFASKGYLLNIDSYAYQTGLDLSDYVSLGYDKYDGHLYGLPQVTDVLALLYNKADIPSPPGTMASFEADVVGVVHKNKAKYGFETDGEFYNTLPFLFACGGGMLDQRNNNILVNNAGSVEGLQFLLNLESNTNHVMPSKVDFSKSSIDPVTDFMTGKTAMIFDGPWDVSKILTGPSFKDNHGNLGIASIPRGPAGQTGSPLGGQSYVIYSGTAYPAEAYKFIEFMSSEPSQITIAEANHTLPTRHSAYRAGVLSDPFISAFLGIKSKSPVVPRPTITQAAYLFDMADPSIWAALAGTQRANEALNTVANSWNRLGAGNEIPQSALTPGRSQTACS